MPSASELMAVGDRVVVSYLTELARHAVRPDRDDPLVEADHLIGISALEDTFILVMSHFSETYEITAEHWLQLGVPAGVVRAGGLLPPLPECDM